MSGIGPGRDTIQDNVSLHMPDCPVCLFHPSVVESLVVNQDKPKFSAGLVTTVLVLGFFIVYALVVLHGVDTPR